MRSSISVAVSKRAGSTMALSELALGSERIRETTDAQVNNRTASLTLR